VPNITDHVLAALQLGVSYDVVLYDEALRHFKRRPEVHGCPLAS
jgi:hypothetical protein